MNIWFKKIDIGDLEILRNWRMQENVTKYLLTDPIISKEDQERWFSQISKDKTRLDYVIMVDDVKIGYYGITNIDFIKGSCEIGFYIGNEDYRGKGLFGQIYYVSENIIIDDLRLNKIIIRVFEDNPILKKYFTLGFLENPNEKKEFYKGANEKLLLSLYKKV